MSFLLILLLLLLLFLLDSVVRAINILRLYTPIRYFV
jgi:hypothetical protein